MAKRGSSRELLIRKATAEIVSAPRPLMVASLDTRTTKAAFPASVPAILLALRNRYQFGSDIREKQGLPHDLYGLVSWCGIAELQRSALKHLPARQAFADRLVALAKEFNRSLAPDEIKTARELARAINVECATTRRIARGVLFESRAGAKISLGRDAFRAAGGHGGGSTDPHVNRLLHDLALLFHDRHVKNVPLRRSNLRTEGRTRWTDVACFLVGVWYCRAPQSTEVRVLEPLLQPLAKAYRRGADSLAAEAKKLLQSRVRQFRRSRPGTEFASRQAAAGLRRAIHRYAQQRKAIRAAWPKKSKR